MAMYQSSSEVPLSWVEEASDANAFQNIRDIGVERYDLLQTSIRLRFPKFSKGFFPYDFKDFIEENIGNENVVALGRLSFPNEWQIQLSNADIREKLIRMWKTKINMRTCWIFPLSPYEVRGFIHWMPSSIPNDKIDQILRNHGKVLFIERQKETSFALYKTNVRYFGLMLRSDQTIEQIPYLATIESHMYFIKISGRKPICFHCHEIGHLKKYCNEFYEKLDSYSKRPSGQSQRRRIRRRRYDSNVQIESVKRLEQGVITDPKELEQHDLPVTGPQLEDQENVDLPGNIGDLFPPIEQLRNLEMNVAQTLSNTAEALRRRIEVAANFLYGELNR